MTAKAKFGYVGGVIFLAACAVLLGTIQKIRRVREEVIEASRKHAGIEVKIQQTERDIAAADTKTPASQANLAERHRNPSAPVTTQPATDPVLGGTLGRFIQDPRLQAQYLAAQRTNLSARYGPYFRSHDLPPEQIKRLNDLIMDREERRMDILDTVPGVASNINYDGDALAMNPLTVSVHPSESGADLSGDGQAAIELLQQQDRSFETAATDLLGPQGYQQLQQYERALPAREIVDSLAGSLTTTSDALSAEQADQLTQILANASPYYQRGETADDLGHGNWSAQVGWSQALDQAKNVLSASQLGVLSRITAPLAAGTQLHSTLRAAASATNSLPAASAAK